MAVIEMLSVRIKENATPSERALGESTPAVAR
jgi:hypothetical protein